MRASLLGGHLKSEMAADDPWRLNGNKFEQQRYAVMRDQLACRENYRAGLEVGCAAGAFAQFLQPICERLHVIDVLPEALDRARQRLGACGNVSWRMASVTDPLSTDASFDLIVVAEVLYYLPDIAALRRAVDNLADHLEPGGLLIFCSAVDDACERWGLFGGAETTMREWDRRLRETNRMTCTGADWGEDCRIVSYTRDAAAAAGPGSA